MPSYSQNELTRLKVKTVTLEYSAYFDKWDCVLITKAGERYLSNQYRSLYSALKNAIEGLACQIEKEKQRRQQGNEGSSD